MNINLKIWPFGKYSEPPKWIQCLIIVFMGLAQYFCVCVGDNWLWDPRDWWKWRRLWKSDGQVETEERQRRARCCANDRDQWRAWAREQDLIPRQVRFPQLQLRMCQVRFRAPITVSYLSALLNIERSVRSSSSASLFKLPPELRKRIFVECILEWSAQRLEGQRQRGLGNPIPPYEPPLTRVCRMLRAECLVLYYRTARFPLILHIREPYKRPLSSLDAVQWYQYLGPEKLSLIRHMELAVCMRHSAPLPSNDPIVYHLDLHKRGNVITITVAPDYYQRISPIEGELMDSLLQKFTSTARSLGSAGFVTARDVYKFTE